MTRFVLQVWALVAAILAVFLPASAATAAPFPAKDLQGIIMWGAGGATDNVARAITPHVEAALGRTIVLQNKPGATGAIATQWVYSQPADGYTLLYGAENPQLYRILRISNLDYKDFYPINVIARGVGVIVCNLEAPWRTLEELFADARKRPGMINMGSTGPGGLPYVVGALLKKVNGVTFNPIPFGGEGPALTAMQGGHVQFTTAGLTAAREHIRAGRVRALALVSDQPVAGLEGVPLITDLYPGYKKYLPWGPFYGVWVKRQVPASRVQVLVKAFRTGFQHPKFQAFLQDFGAVPMGISGEQADAFLRHWQSVSAWLLYDAGAAKVSPAELGIPRP